ncbi:hypothetical protein KSC_072800 [Ktedonobacter sp. SOSP1-52]|nr:hypothetical protein KSC_072800 [Ktedonobacter sp. SOSP1-52]
MKHLKCLFLDWHNTLSTSLFWGHLSDPSHISHQMMGLITSYLFQSSGRVSTILEPWMRGELTSEDIVHILCQEQKLDPGIVLHELMVSCQRMQFVSQEVPHYVSNLRAKGIQVVIATDNMDTFQRWTVPNLQLDTLFDAILCSSDLRSLKADRNHDGSSLFFAEYLRKHHVEHGESLLLDDGDEEFGQVIRRFGIHYQQIAPGVGLVPALQTLLDAL